MSGGPPGRGTGPPRVPPPSTGWTIVSYLLGGMILYGLIGWLLGRWLGFPALFPIGLLAGLALSLVLVVLRYGRPRP
jgi:hypothetical protein